VPTIRHTVLKHEALAVRRQRSQLLGADESELDRLESRTTDSPEDRALAADEVSRAAAALRRLKPDEVRALWLKASGLSYAEIMEQEGWSYTKVNRCLAEGRASLARHRSAIESGAECEQYMPELSRLLDGEASRKELRPLRAHLKTCTGCRAELRILHERGDAIRLVLPSGVLAGSAASQASDVPGVLTRLYEFVATTLHDRAALSAMKLQAAIEATSTGKLAAVAASAAAVAGGGAAAATEAPDRLPRQSPAPHQRALTPSKPAPIPSAKVGRRAAVPVVRTSGAGELAARQEKPTAKPSRPSARRASRAAVRREFDVAEASVTRTESVEAGVAAVPASAESGPTGDVSAPAGSSLPPSAPSPAPSSSAAGLEFSP